MMGIRDRKHESARALDLDASMQGSLVFKDPVNLRINGRFEGTLNTMGNLTIGENAVVNADITGESIIIAGKVHGNIHAISELKIVAPATVIGDIKTPLLSIAEGAVFEGHCRMVSRNSADSQSRLAVMTHEELATYLEVDAAMILDWVNMGKLPGTRDGDVWKFDRTKIDEWVAAGKIK